MKLAVLAVTAFLLFVPGSAFTQTCLTRDDLKTLLSQANSRTTVTLNKKLQSELVKLATKQQETLFEAVKENAKQSAIDKLQKLNEQNAIRLCEILRTNGWPTADLVGRNGVSAAFHLLRN